MMEETTEFDDMEQAVYFEVVETYRNKLQGILKPGRYEHSLSVSYTCICLAMRYGISLRKAEIAGLIHDCAKQFKDEELIHLCEEYGIALNAELIGSPQVLHSLFGPTFAKQLFCIHDEEILSAVYYHTLGKPDMSMLEKIVFVADYIEGRRNQAKRLPELRMLAFTDIDRCVYEINKDTVTYLESRGVTICDATLKTYAYYKQLVKGHQEESTNGK